MLEGMLVKNYYLEKKGNIEFVKFKQKYRILTLSVEISEFGTKLVISAKHIQNPNWNL